MVLRMRLCFHPPKAGSGMRMSAPLAVSVPAAAESAASAP